MLLKPETHNYQSQLADYCKTGVITEIEGANTDRLHHYRRLTYNIIKSALSTAYPIAKKTLTDDEWIAMVDDYFANHKMNSPLVWKMPFEFYEFCQEKEYGEKFGKPYLNDLLYFEWIEIEVHTMEDKLIPLYVEEGDLLEDNLVITPEYELLSFDYPVHKFKGDELLDKKGSYFVLIFRKKSTGAVRFINLSAFLAYLLEVIAEGDKSLRSAIVATSQAFGVDENKAIQHGLAFANDMLAQEFILGYQK